MYVRNFSSISFGKRKGEEKDGCTITQERNTYEKVKKAVVYYLIKFIFT